MSNRIFEADELILTKYVGFSNKSLLKAKSQTYSRMNLAFTNRGSGNCTF